MQINKTRGRKCGQLKWKVLKINFHIIVSHECDKFLILRGENKFKYLKAKFTGASRTELVGNLE
jgi:hypothetical protein